jgi:hypothetical protein
MNFSLLGIIYPCLLEVFQYFINKSVLVNLFDIVIIMFLECYNETGQLSIYICLSCIAQVFKHFEIII